VPCAIFISLFLAYLTIFFSNEDYLASNESVISELSNRKDLGGGVVA
jgi:hypothetical protein